MTENLLPTKSVNPSVLTDTTDLSTVLSYRAQHIVNTDLPKPFVGSYNAPSILSRASAPYKPSTNENIKFYSSPSAYAFTLNLCLGIGVLGLPQQFNETGYLLSTIILFMVGILSFFSASWIIDTMCRAEGILQLTNPLNQSSNNITTSTSQIFNDMNTVDFDFIDLIPKYIITTRKFEINQLVGMFCGKYIRIFYEIMITLYIFSACWSYTSVFASALSRQIGIGYISSNCDIGLDNGDNNNCYYLYLIYVAIFACIVIPLSCLDMVEQKIIQICLTILRYTIIFIMTSTSIGLMYSNYIPNDHGGFTYMPDTPKPNLGPDNELFKFNGLFGFISVAAFAVTYHHGIPSLSQPVKNKLHLPYIVFCVNMSCFLLFTMLSISVSLYFGSNIETPCTLNWGEFKGFDPNQNNSIWVLFIQWIVVLFPAMGVLSAFPLNAVTLSNNILVALFPIHLTKKKKYIILVRIICALIPIIGGSLFYDLGIILEFGGCFGICIGFIIPALIQYQSRKLCTKVLLNKNGDITPYTRWYCDKKFVLVGATFGIIAFVAALYNAIAACF